MSSHNAPALGAKERRYLTAMFCDLVGSTRLVQRLDLEDWDEVKEDYLEVCKAVIRRFDGYVAEEPGDGLLVYFGWPIAHEDDPRRAVRTGLALIDAVRDLGMHTRVTIDTGPVVLGERASGMPLNKAWLLQSFAKPDTVVISQATLDLVRGYFTYEDLGTRNLEEKIEGSVRAYRVLAASGADTRLEALGDRRLTPFIGREVELNSVLQLWKRAGRGQSQTVEISGEPGIGKSRLVMAISERVPNTIVFRCSEINVGSALFPVTSRLERLLGFEQLEDPGQKLDRLEQKLQGVGLSSPDVVPLIASELSLPLLDRYQAPDLTPGVTIQKKRQRTLGVLVDWILREAEREPVVVVWEDLHWADPSTLELIGMIIERATTAPILTLLTFRPEFQPPWPAPASLTEVTLGRLERPMIQEMISEITGGRSFPTEVIDQIVEKTDGVPLFVEELLQAVLDSGGVRVEDDRYVVVRPSSLTSIPEKLEGWLLSRLDRLGPAKAIAQRAAILGRTFSQDLLRALIDAENGNEHKRAEAWGHAQQCLSQLVEADVLHRRQGRQTWYEFKHALIQDAARQSLLKRDRRAYHLQTAKVLEAQFGQLVEMQPELAAHHYTEALDVKKALHYWQLAGERARDRSANREAVRHFAEAHKCLEALPESEERDRIELDVRISNFTPVIAVEGYVAETNFRSAERALELCRKLNDVDKLFPVLYTLWALRIVAAEYHDALNLTAEFLQAASNQADPAPRLMSHRLRGISMFMVGELTAAEEHLKRSLSLYEPQSHGDLKHQYGQDPRSTCEAFMSLSRWLRGYANEAAEWSRMAVEHAEQSRHSNTWGYVRWFGAATFEAFRRDVAKTTHHTTALITFTEKEGLPVWRVYAKLLHGWTLVQSDRIEDGIAEMKVALREFENSLHMGFLKSFLLSLLGEAYAKLGRIEEGLAQLDAAWSFSERTGEAFWKAEVLRLKGELLLQARDQSVRHRQEAEACFLTAMEIACGQGARALQLRAAMSLARLWCRERPDDARRILSQAYDGFGDVLDSSDVRQARELLQQLPSV